MSTVESPPPAPAPAPEPRTCPRCGAPLVPGQEWCLSCGADTRSQIAGTPRWRGADRDRRRARDADRGRPRARLPRAVRRRRAGRESAYAVTRAGRARPGRVGVAGAVADPVPRRGGVAHPRRRGVARARRGGLADAQSRRGGHPRARRDRHPRRLVPGRRVARGRDGLHRHRCARRRAARPPSAPPRTSRAQGKDAGVLRSDDFSVAQPRLLGGVRRPVRQREPGADRGRVHRRRGLPAPRRSRGA